jgi:hypothetical protein
VNIYIPPDIKEDHQIVMFRLRHQQTGFLGQALVGMIRLPEVDMKQSIIPGLDDDKLLDLASILVDESLGTFERCYSLVRCLRGDIEKARLIASQLIICESMYQNE